jgi:hypothetical protein
MTNQEIKNEARAIMFNMTLSASVRNQATKTLAKIRMDEMHEEAEIRRNAVNSK